MTESFALAVEDVQPSQSHLNGRKLVLATTWFDFDDLPLALSVECVEWCREEGVTDVRGLFGRTVNTETFERRWADRCQRAAERLGEG